MKVKEFINALCIAIITVAFGMNIYISASNYGMDRPWGALFAQSTSNGNDNPNGSNGSTNGFGGNSSSTDSITAGRRMIPNMHMEITSTNSSYTSKKEIMSKNGKFFGIEIENSFKNEQTIPIVIETSECKPGPTKCDQDKQQRVWKNLKTGKVLLIEQPYGYRYYPD